MAVACAEEEKSYNSYMIPYFYLDHLTFGPLRIQVWGFFVALGIIVGTLVAIKRGKNIGIKRGVIVDLVFWMTLSSFLGGKAVFLLTSNGFNWTGKNMRLNDGFSSLGAIIFGAIIAYYYVKGKNISFAQILNIFGPALLLVDGISRIGCFFLHEHLGWVTNFIFAVNNNGVIRHDLGLYFALASLLGFIIIFALERTRKISSGTVGYLSIFWYFLARFLLEFLYENGGEFGVEKYVGLTLMQYVSLFMVFVLLVVTLRIIPKVNFRDDP
jgi:phosphatidylglycerol:prolipoprotein diacylglycerol transferase